MRRVTTLLTILLLTSGALGQVSSSRGWKYPRRYSPEEPVEPLPWNSRAAAHLLRRAGFSAPPEEIQRYVDLGFEAVLDELLNYEQIDDSAMELGLATDQRYRLFVLRNGQWVTRLRFLREWWLYRMIHSRRQLLEKMTFFWHDHFATSFFRVHHVFGARPISVDPSARLEGNEKPLMLIQNETLREHALGNFKAMVHAIARDPAMLIWLDNYKNRKGRPNENWARELLELFTLGESSESAAYTEFDIQEAARAFTGWTVISPNRDGELGEAYDFIYSPYWHDFEPKTFLGQPIISPEGAASIRDGERVIDIIFEHPQTARYLAKKLWEYFVYPNPSDRIIDQMAGVFRSHDYEIKPLMRAIFEHPHFMSGKACRSKIKSPVEFILGFFRELGLSSPQNLDRLSGIFGLGQDLFAPPDVGGWTHDQGWINTGSVITRTNLMTYFTCNRGAPQDGVKPYLMDDEPFPDLCQWSPWEDQIELEAIIQENHLSFAPEVVAYLTNAMLHGDATIDTAYVLEDYMNTGEDGRPLFFDINDPEMVDTKVRGVIFLISVLPVYQLN